MWTIGLILSLAGFALGAFVTFAYMKAGSRDLGDAIAMWMHVISLVAIGLGVAMLVWG